MPTMNVGSCIVTYIMLEVKMLPLYILLLWKTLNSVTGLLPFIALKLGKDILKLLKYLPNLNANTTAFKHFIILIHFFKILYSGSEKVGEKCSHSERTVPSKKLVLGFYTKCWG